MENYQITVQGNNIEECYLKPMVYASQSSSITSLRILIPVNNKWELDPVNSHQIKKTKKTAYVYINLIEKKSQKAIDVLYLNIELDNNFKKFQVSVVFGDPEEGGCTMLRSEDIEIEPPF